jgi:hypothetical protein
MSASCSRTSCASPRPKPFAMGRWRRLRLGAYLVPMALWSLVLSAFRRVSSCCRNATSRSLHVRFKAHAHRDDIVRYRLSLDISLGSSAWDVIAHELGSSQSISCSTSRACLVPPGPAQRILSAFDVDLIGNNVWSRSAFSLGRHSCSRSRFLQRNPQLSCKESYTGPKHCTIRRPN